MNDTKRVVLGLLIVAVLGGAVITKLRSTDDVAATQQAIADTQSATMPAAAPVSVTDAASAQPTLAASDETLHRQIYLQRSQTLYLAAAQFPGVSTDPKPQDAYQDRLLAVIDKRFGISKAEGITIDNEGAAKMWPILGADGTISQPH